MTLERLRRAMQSEERLCVGVLSGTSVDAAEVALCRIRGTGEALSLSLVAHHSIPFDAATQARVIAAETIADACELNAELGEFFAAAVLEALRRAGVRADEVDVIGSHGQTVAHLPPGTARFASTLQIGDASVIAERTGIPVVADFRTRDMAAGGQGAPLVPYLDWAVFRMKGAWRALLNIGGISNVSVVGEALSDTVAFDTGPGNMLLDALSVKATAGALRYDRDGELSSQGSVLPELLEELLRHPFLAAHPPKSAGREQFGAVLSEDLWRRFAGRPNDLIATAAELTVESIARAVETWVLPTHMPLDGLYVSGGGTRNPTLMKGLQRRLPSVRVAPLDTLGFPEAAKEAACFALLASEFLAGTPQNVPSATGAANAVVMGKMVP